MNPSITFSLKPVPPFRLDLTAWALRRRPNNLIEQWDGQTYRWVLVMDGYPAEVAVRQSEPPASPRIRVKLTGRRISPQMKASVSATLERLLEFLGVGRWSAEYVLLRGLGRLNVYPGDDVGARNNLKSWLKLRKPLDYDSVHRVTAKWQPYAGVVYFHMLLNRLDSTGNLAPKSFSLRRPHSQDPLAFK